MTEVTLDQGEIGADIDLPGRDQLFYVASGVVQFSTDGGSTWVPFANGEKIIFASGTTVSSWNDGGDPAVFRYMEV